jgi:acetylornithine deacetylase/succinyl-diaminopimelate desuccinylase-like protein
LKAGFRSNVIPSEAEATLDIRALPGEDMPGFIRELVRVIDDPTVEIIPPSEPSRPSSVPSRMDTVMYKALESVQMRLYPDAVTLPQMMTGGTDMAQLRAKGVQAYGIGPISDEGDRYAHGPHSDDERIEEAALQRFVRLLWEVVLEVAETR